jgi:UDP-N-acetylmuramoyl-tripeptide--D-alanyl-D-alanine ligase
LFFALKGKSFDGNRFASDALAAGAGYAVIDDADFFLGERTVLVDDVLAALQGLARLHRMTLGTPLIAVTGTNGKTTTKELLAAVLATKFNLLYTEGNLNNHIGVPLTLLRLTAGHEMAVVEMGASHAGDIRELVGIALPDYGIITNLGRAHLEGFGSFEGVVRTKAELYDYMRLTGGAIFIRKDDRDLMAIGEGIRQVTYGGDGAFVAGRVRGVWPFLSFEWMEDGEVYGVDTRLTGAYNIDNIMAAVAVGRHFGIPAGSIGCAIAAYEPSNNRSQIRKTAHNTLIIDAYNANPDSMKAAIGNLASMPVAPRAVILGDMKELGVRSLELHGEILDEVEKGRFDRVILCGEQFMEAASGRGFTSYPTTGELVDALSLAPLAGFHILIKGSRSMALEAVAGVL